MSARCALITGHNNHLIRSGCKFLRSPPQAPSESKSTYYLESGLPSRSHSDGDQTPLNLPEATMVTLLKTFAPSSSDSNCLDKPAFESRHGSFSCVFAGAQVGHFGRESAFVGSVMIRAFACQHCDSDCISFEV